MLHIFYLEKILNKEYVTFNLNKSNIKIFKRSPNIVLKISLFQYSKRRFFKYKSDIDFSYGAEF